MRHNEYAGKRTMISWRVLLIVDDYFTPDQEEAILEAISEVIDSGQVQQFIQEKIDDYPVQVEVIE